MVAVALVLVAEHYHSWWIMLPAATMIAREIIISSLRVDGGNWQTQQRGGVLDRQSENHGADDVAGGFAVAAGLPVEYVAIGLLYIAAVLTFWSMFQYLNAARNDLLEP